MVRAPPACTQRHERTHKGILALCMESLRSNVSEQGVGHHLGRSDNTTHHHNAQKSVWEGPVALPLLRYCQ